MFFQRSKWFIKKIGFRYVWWLVLWPTDSWKPFFCSICSSEPTSSGSRCIIITKTERWNCKQHLNSLDWSLLNIHGQRFSNCTFQPFSVLLVHNQMDHLLEHGLLLHLLFHLLVWVGQILIGRLTILMGSYLLVVW